MNIYYITVSLKFNQNQLNMKLFLTLITCTIALCMHLQIQAQFTYIFSNATATGTIPNLTASNVTQGNNNGTTTFLAPGLPASSTTFYAGASAGFNGNCSARTGVINTGTSGSAYAQVVLTPAANFWVNISAIKWGNYSISTTGPATLNIYTSLDNYTTPVTTVSSGALNTWTLLNPTFTPINGLTSTALTIRIYASGGIGTSTANTANWRIDDLVITAAAQNGTAGQIPKYTSPTTFANSIMAEANNNIGVGTITPTYKLDIAGNLKTTQDANINGIVVGKGTNGNIYSTAIGYNALNIATGPQNTAIGYAAGSNITTGQLNTAVGYASLFSSGGSGNTALGSYAMQYWQSGFYNIGLGYDAMHGTNSTSGGTGAGNIAIGRQVMGVANVSGNYSVGLGYQALPFLTSGSYNVALGPTAGYTLTTGSGNILIGSAVNTSSATASNELNIGNWIYGTNGSIGIGTATPQNKFEITHGTTGNSGLRFTNLTASSTAAASSGKVLSVNANGDVVLEQAGGGSVPDGSETIVTAGANIIVGGTGRLSDPYVISATVPTQQWGPSSIGTNNIVNNNTGGVLIGTGFTNLTSGYKLYVADGIITEKVKVKLKANWPDYVFEKDYKLLSLNETEKFIKLNNHLPGVLSAKDVKKEGIELGETNAVLLKKIEELTLYLIAADKEIKELQKKVNKLDTKN